MVDTREMILTSLVVAIVALVSPLDATRTYDEGKKDAETSVFNDFFDGSVNIDYADSGMDNAETPGDSEDSAWNHCSMRGSIAGFDTKVEGFVLCPDSDEEENACRLKYTTDAQGGALIMYLGQSYSTPANEKVLFTVPEHLTDEWRAELTFAQIMPIKRGYPYQLAVAYSESFRRITLGQQQWGKCEVTFDEGNEDAKTFVFSKDNAWSYCSKRGSITGPDTKVMEGFVLCPDSEGEAIACRLKYTTGAFGGTLTMFSGHSYRSPEETKVVLDVPIQSKDEWTIDRIMPTSGSDLEVSSNTPEAKAFEKVTLEQSGDKCELTFDGGVEDAKTFVLDPWLHCNYQDTVGTTKWWRDGVVLCSDSCRVKYTTGTENGTLAMYFGQSYAQPQHEKVVFTVPKNRMSSWKVQKVQQTTDAVDPLEVSGWPWKFKAMTLEQAGANCTLTFKAYHGPDVVLYI